MVYIVCTITHEKKIPVTATGTYKNSSLDFLDTTSSKTIIILAKQASRTNTKTYVRLPSSSLAYCRMSTTVRVRNTIQQVTMKVSANTSQSNMMRISGVISKFLIRKNARAAKPRLIRLRLMG